MSGKAWIAPLLLATMIAPGMANARGDDGWKEYRKEEKEFYKERRKRAEEYHKERAKRGYYGPGGYDFDD